MDSQGGCDVEPGGDASQATTGPASSSNFATTDATASRFQQCVSVIDPPATAAVNKMLGMQPCSGIRDRCGYALRSRRSSRRSTAIKHKQSETLADVESGAECGDFMSAGS